MIRRDVYMNQLHRLRDKNIIKVVTGIRRCGKSTLLHMFQKELAEHGIEKERMIAVNLESGDFRKIRTADDLYDYVEQRLCADKTNYVFLDEVQNVPDFQRAVDWLYAKPGADLYLTGSNAYLLSGELATLLSGRHMEIRMLPLSFAEFVSVSPETGNLPQLYSKYLVNSSFPGVLEYREQDDIRAYIEGIYNTVLIKDVATRRRISDIAMLQSIVEFMYDNIGNLCSAAKIAGAMTSAGRKISTNTVEAYIQALVDSFILYKANRYDVHGKERLKNGAKYYAVDIGLRNYLLGTSFGDVGHILENIVYLELLRRGNEVFVGKAGTSEVDFVTIHNGQKAYYQVSQSVLDENTLHRELAPLQGIKDNYPKYLLTMDYFPNISFEGIQHCNVLDWLSAPNT